MPEPKQKTEELVRETERGRSERTPWLALTGVHLAVLGTFVLIGGIAFLAYLLA